VVDEVGEPLLAPDGTSVDVRRAVNELPIRQRTAIVLFHYADLPVADIAALMDCSVGTVKSTLHDARRALALRLGASYDQD
jgi:RNA polymerase sigma-70 factor (ECF subfamily)